MKNTISYGLLTLSLLICFDAKAMDKDVPDGKEVRSITSSSGYVFIPAEVVWKIQNNPETNKTTQTVTLNSSKESGSRFSVGLTPSWPTLSNNWEQTPYTKFPK